MPIEIKTLKTSAAQRRATKKWGLNHPEFHYEFDHNAYYQKNKERRRLQSLHCKFVKKEFMKFLNILL